DGAVVTAAGRAVRGRLPDPEPPHGTPVVAVFRPSSVAIYREALSGSPRNSTEVTVTALEPHGDLVRVRADGLHADVTPSAAADLALAPGARVHFVVKAAEVDVYRAH
ncbi:MAG TPA: TOBE domain-containing protein, partial [Nocardioides sp.]